MIALETSSGRRSDSESFLLFVADDMLINFLCRLTFPQLCQLMTIIDEAFEK